MPSSAYSPRGSLWHRWDPHIHAPGTLLNDQFGGDWETYLNTIENSDPRIEALGVTDYFCIETYLQARAFKQSGRLPNVELLFANVEMRLDIKTEKQKGINLHLLFSPDDPEHENQIIRILGLLQFSFGKSTFQCTLSELERLGRAFDIGIQDQRAARREGANQFKVSLKDLQSLFRAEEWLRKNCLIAVSGNVDDGTSGLQKDDSFAATRREIESFADIIFASSKNQRDFWLGKKDTAPPEQIEKTYRTLKPCLHGSDAHDRDKVGQPDLKRYTWIKGDLTFESLRQAVIEPERRVWIGSELIPDAAKSWAIENVVVSDAAWFGGSGVPINDGLVAVIGPRGSGKTALADVIACGANSLSRVLTESSFLERACTPVNLIGEAKVQLDWSDGSQKVSSLNLENYRTAEEPEEICYLSQHFVEQLCSASGLARELVLEIERVIFEATDTGERYETNSFQELADFLLDPIRSRRAEFHQSIGEVTAGFLKEEMLEKQLPEMLKKNEETSKQIANVRKEQQQLVPKGKEARAAQLATLEWHCSTQEAKLENLRKRKKGIIELKNETEVIRNSREPKRFQDMKLKFANANLNETEWQAFKMDFIGNVSDVLEKAERIVDGVIKLTLEGPAGFDSTADPRADWPLNHLKQKRDALKAEVGIDREKQKKYETNQQILSQLDSTLRRLATDIEFAKGANERKKSLAGMRRKLSADAMQTFIDEESILRQLYNPLSNRLHSETGSLGKLKFEVRRRVDIDAWVVRGEGLFDLRIETKIRGHGSLRKAAESILLPSWRGGTASEVATAMDEFRSEYLPEFLKAIPPSISADERNAWIQRVAAWFYDTSHISIEYGVQYDGVAIEQLSPGTRGIVLLLLYLAVDQLDRRPLLIDQPEENLDPKSVFSELLPHFREVRHRRQVIIVTHNANLVVNTDADQVIVASARRVSDYGLPSISYESGSLENPQIRKLVCEILEGGDRAFLERERRYRLRWDFDR